MRVLFFNPTDRSHAELIGSSSTFKSGLRALMITTPLRVGSLLNLRTDDTSVCPAVSAPFAVSLSLIALSVLLSTSTTLQFINQRKVKLRRDGCCTAAAAAKSTK